MYRSTDDDECVRIVHAAIDRGINYIDVAPWYGHGKAETVLGKVGNWYARMRLSLKKGSCLNIVCDDDVDVECHLTCHFSRQPTQNKSRF